MSETIPQMLTLDLIRQHFVPLSPSTLYQMISEGKFPAATKQIGRKIRLWHRDIVEAWAKNEWAAPGKEVPGVA